MPSPYLNQIKVLQGLKLQIKIIEVQHSPIAVIEWPVGSHLDRTVEVKESAFEVFQAQVDVSSVVNAISVSRV